MALAFSTHLDPINMNVGSPKSMAVWYSDASAEQPATQASQDSEAAAEGAAFVAEPEEEYRFLPEALSDDEAFAARTGSAFPADSDLQFKFGFDLSPRSSAADPDAFDRLTPPREKTPFDPDAEWTINRIKPYPDEDEHTGNIMRAVDEEKFWSDKAEAVLAKSRDRQEAIAGKDREAAVEKRRKDSPASPTWAYAVRHGAVPTTLVLPPGVRSPSALPRGNLTPPEFPHFDLTD